MVSRFIWATSMVHVADVADASIFMLSAPADSVNGEIFNIGSDANNYRIRDLGEVVAEAVPRDVEIEWSTSSWWGMYRLHCGGP